MSSRLTAIQKFKAVVKKYWYIAIPVHLGTSALWFGSFYGATKSGLDFVPVLEKTGLPEKYIEPLKKGSLGNVAQALLLYKIVTPFRYATTLAVTRSTIKYLRRSATVKKTSARIETVWVNFASVAVLMFASSFAAVPLYKLYCQSTGKGGQAFKDKEDNIVSMKRDERRPITVKFNSTTHSSISWNFEPLQDKIIVHPGETALAFYRATNPLDELVIGVATYTVLPYEAGVYFNKIQCFCFEEQMLQPNEDVFMPVLFYIDPEFSKDPHLGSTDEIILSYTFFRSKDGELI